MTVRAGFPARGRRHTLHIVVHDVAQFLVRQPPFDELDGEALEQLASSVEIEFFPAGKLVFAQGAEPSSHAYLVRTGAIELLDEGRVLDLLGEGELFGHPSMLSGLPTGFAARAHEDTLCYRLPAEAIIPLLSGPTGLQFVARSLWDRSRIGPTSGIGADVVDDPGSRAAEALLRMPPVLVEPDTTIRRAAELMTDAGVSVVVVRGREGALGILTDRDLRTQVVAGDVPTDAPVSRVMTADPLTAAPDELGDKVLMDMLAAGVRHMPVIAADGGVLGVLEAQDLLVAEGRAPFRLRRAIDTATDATALEHIAAQIRPALTELYDTRVAPAQVAAIMALLVDALTRRLIELGIERHGAPPAPFAWLALGSMGRAESAPSSDLDSALVWEGDDDDPQIQAWMAALAGDVLDGLQRCGLRGDTHGVGAADVRLARSADAWQTALSGWIADPRAHQGLIYLSLLADARVVWGEGSASAVLHRVRDVRHDPRLLRLFAQLALNDRPPTGFLRDAVLEHGGGQRGRLDIKDAGLTPVTSLARYAGLAAGQPVDQDAAAPGRGGRHGARRGGGAHAGGGVPPDARPAPRAPDRADPRRRGARRPARRRRAEPAHAPLPARGVSRRDRRAARRPARPGALMRGTPWTEASYCAIDIEATGLDPKADELLSFATVPIDEGRIRVGDAVYHLVRPNRMPDERTVVVHGIRPADVTDAPAVDDVLDDLIDALAGRVMVVHVAWVERAFLTPLLRRRGARLPKRVIDTEALGRLWLAQTGRRTRTSTTELAELARALGLPAHRPHHALGDALTTAQVFLALATHLSGAAAADRGVARGRGRRARAARATTGRSGPSRRRAHASLMRPWPRCSSASMTTTGAGSPSSRCSSWPPRRSPRTGT